MYTKNLTEDLRLRLSTTDMDFLRSLSESRACSVSETIRSIIGEYRRSLDAVEAIKKALALAERKEGSCPNGDTETDKHNLL